LGKVQITIDVSDSPELRKAFRIASDQLEVGRSALGKFFLGFGLWLTTKLSLAESVKITRYAERHYPLLSLMAAIIQLKEMGFPKAGELERLLEDVRAFLEKRRDGKGENGSDA